MFLVWCKASIYVAEDPSPDVARFSRILVDAQFNDAVRGASVLGNTFL